MVENIMPIWWGIGGVGLILIISILTSFLLYRRMRRFETAYISLQTFMSGQQMDIVLKENNQKMSELQQKIDKCDTKISSIESKLRVDADRVELLRFKAFENVGSDLSFALALLNQEGNGVVLSSIHNREEARVYAKPVEAGQSSYSLSNEEKEVISKAMQGPRI